MNIKMKVTNNTNISFLGAVLLVGCLITSANAANLAVTKAFVDTEVLNAADLNGSFTEVEAAVNDNDARITASGDGSSLDAPDGAPVDAVSVDNDGNVNILLKLGINRTPIQELSVEGDIYSTRGAKLGDPTNEGSRSALLELRNTIPWASVISATNQSGTALLNLSNAGNVTVTGNVTAAGHITVSDSRFKKNIVSLENPMDMVLKLRGVNFKWNTDTYERFNSLPGKQVGFIAQEVSKVLPEIVYKNEDGYLGVSYNAIIPLLVEAIKEQQQAIKDLKEEIGTLEAIRKDVRALRQQLNVIQAKNDDKQPVDEQRLSMIDM